MPLEIVFVRHGQSEGNRDRRFTGHSAAPLTALGHQQAAATARALVDSGAPTPGIDAIYASDLRRAVDTAHPLAVATGLPIQQSPGLRERDVGALTGMSFDEVQAQWPEAWAALLSRDPEFRPGNGESHRMCAERVGRFLDELLVRHEHGRVVLYSHGVAINHMLRHVLGLAPNAPRVSFQIDNCSLHRVHHGPSGLFRVAATNDVSHLSHLAERGPGE